MNCIIVEDSEFSVLLLMKCIEREGGLVVTQVFKSADDAFTYLIDNQCDLIFLDMETGEMSGIDLIKQLVNCPNVIIISSKDGYAAEAFNFDVVDYIIKPLTFERFHKAIQKVYKIKENLQSSSGDYFYLKYRNKMVQIFFTDVVYVEALADYVNIFTTDNKYTILSTMKGMENQFPGKDFMRIHRSYIVRLDKISEIEETTVSVGNKVIPISKTNKADLMKRIKLI